MSWVAVGAAAVSVVGGAIVSNNNKPDAPTPRNLNGELTGINGQYGDTLNNYLNGSGAATTNSLNNLNTLSSGQFDVAKFFQSNPDAAQQWQDHFTNGEMAGWTPEQFAKSYMEYFHTSDSPQTVDQQFNSYKSGGIPDIAASLNTQSRTNNLNDVKNLGQDYVDITRGANKGYYDALDSYTTATQQPVTPSASQTQAATNAANGFGTFDPTGLQAHAANGNPLLTQLNQRAMNAGPSGLQTQQNDLASALMAQGGNLSASDLRNVQQSSRAGFTSRGLDATNASVSDEVLQTDAARRARLIQNLGIAQSVQNQGLAEQNQQNQFGLGVNSQNYGYDQLGLQAQLANQNFGLNSFNANLQSQLGQQGALNQSATLAEQQRQAQLAAQGNAASLQRGGFLDPFAAIIGSSDQNLLGQLLGQNNANASTQANLYNGLLGYGGDLNNTNYNANAAAGIAGYNGQQAMYGSLIQAGGQIGGAYMANRGTGSTTTANNSSLSGSANLF